MVISITHNCHLQCISRLKDKFSVTDNQMILGEPETKTKIYSYIYMGHIYHIVLKGHLPHNTGQIASLASSWHPAIENHAAIKKRN